MADELLRRNLSQAFDPGPDFPNRLLLSRTMAMLASVRQEPRRRTRMSPILPRLRMTAGLLLVALAVAAVGAFLAAHHPFGDKVPADRHPSSAPLRADPWVGDVVTMVSTTTGWAIKGESILRTTDGGSHWRVVNSSVVLRTGFFWDTPPGVPRYFLDDTHAWFISNSAQEIAQEMQITRTSDGGTTWQKGTAFSPDVHFVGPLQNGVAESELYFVDPQHGWLLLRSKVAWICPPKSFPLPTPTGSSVCSGPLAGPYSAAIYETSDGGDHWRLLAESLGSGSANQVLGLDCRETGMRFDKAGTGWLGFYCDDPLVGPIVGITHDGGQNWEAVSLPYAPTGLLNVTRPIFLADKQGLVQLDYPGILFATGDGGRTWTPHRLPGLGLFADFIDPANGWFYAVDGLYRTTNAGETWTLIYPQTGEPIQTQFLDASNGFGLKIVSAPCTGCGSSVNGVPAELVYQIQQTNDGGHSWTVVQSMVQGP